jgi:hypothetical protein
LTPLIMKTIMTNNYFPWDNIIVPQKELNLIRVDDSHPHAFSWGKDITGKIMLVLSLPALNEDDLRNRKIELAGIKADIKKPENGHIYFQLTLLTKENTDIFWTLCNDLIEKTRSVPDLQAALNLVYIRLERWRAFLSKANRNILTLQEIQGLFAELSFLEDCLDHAYVTAQSAVDGWQGPLGAPHDFIFGSQAIEIKSLSGSFSDGVRISSEGQLTTHLNALYLHVVFLMQDFDCKIGLSLNSLIHRIREKLANGNMLATLDNRLLEFGYIDIPEYEQPCFSISQTRTYDITEDFPRLTPDTIPRGISEVSYFIRFASIENFQKKDFKPGANL